MRRGLTRVCLCWPPPTCPGSWTRCDWPAAPCHHCPGLHYLAFMHLYLPLHRQAMLRRLEHRVHVPPPDAAVRLALLQALLAGRLAPDVQLDTLVDATSGWTCWDVRILAREAAMRPLRRLLAHGDSERILSTCRDGPRLPSSTQLPGRITREDVDAALQVVQPSPQPHAARYAQFAAAQ